MSKLTRFPQFLTIAALLLSLFSAEIAASASIPDNSLLAQAQKPSELTLPPEEVDSVLRLTYLLSLQEDFYQQKGKLASEVSQLLGLVKSGNMREYLNKGDDNYSINIALADPGKTQFTAIAKKSNLSSWTGVVFVVNEANGVKATVTGLCRSDKPSNAPIAMPTLKGYEVQCPPGFSYPFPQFKTTPEAKS